MKGIQCDRDLLGQIILHISKLVQSIGEAWAASNGGREAMAVSVQSDRTTLE